MCGLLARLGAIFAGILSSFRGRLDSWVDRKTSWGLFYRCRLMNDISLGE
jgi:hypothetical protein